MQFLKSNFHKRFIIFFLIFIISFSFFFTTSEKKVSGAVFTGTSLTLITSAFIGLLSAVGIMADKDYFTVDYISDWVKDYWSKDDSIQNGYITFDFWGNMYVGSEMVKPLINMVDDFVSENLLTNSIEIDQVECQFPSYVINLSELPYVMEEIEDGKYSFVSVRYFLNNINSGFWESDESPYFDVNKYYNASHPFVIGDFAYLYQDDGFPNSSFDAGQVKIMFEDYVQDGDPHEITWINFQKSLIYRSNRFPFTSANLFKSANYKRTVPVFCYVNGSVYLLPMFYSTDNKDGTNNYYIDVPYSVPNSWAYNWYGDNGLLWTSETNKCYPKWRIIPTYEYSGRYKELLEKANALSGDLGGIVIENDNWSGVASERELLQKGFDSLINSRDVTYNSDWEIIRSGEVISTADNSTTIDIPVDTSATVVDDVKAVEKENAEAIEATSDWKFSDYKVSGLAQWFPFCIPFDFYYILTIFNADAEAPYFIYTIDLGSNFGSYDVEIDFSKFDSVAQIFRVMMFILFLVGLTLVTRHLIRG